jgi:hypothetical protein
MPKQMPERLTVHIEEAMADWIDAMRGGETEIAEVLAALSIVTGRLIQPLVPEEQLIALKCVREGIADTIAGPERRTQLN